MNSHLTNEQLFFDSITRPHGVAGELCHVGSGVEPAIYALCLAWDECRLTSEDAYRLLFTISGHASPECIEIHKKWVDFCNSIDPEYYKKI